MKFLYFQDFHMHGKNSCNRLGDYQSDLLLKLDEIIQIAKDNKCAGILDGGDLFETEKPSYSVLDAVADKIEKCRLSFHSLFGNHTMAYGHLENSKNTGLAHLQKRCGLIVSLNSIKRDSYETLCSNFIIQGFDYKFNIEDEIKKNGIFIQPPKKNKADKDDSVWKIAIVHALLTPGKFFDNASYVQLKDIKTNADLVLVAHYHKPYTKVIGNTTFLNIGCCGRNNIDEATIEPSVVLLDIDKQNYEVIKLKSAKPANKIFDLAKHNELKDNKKDIKEFLDSLKDINLQSINLGGQIVQIGKEKNINEEIINNLLTKMEKVKNGK